MMRISSALIALSWLALCLVVGVQPSAAAPDAGWEERPHVALKLGAAALEQAQQKVPFAVLVLKLDPGWKIYWRSPGEAGIPTTIDWSRSENLRAAETYWPQPKRARIWNMDTVGYDGEVAFPVALRLVDAGSSTLLRARVAYGVCREICIRDEAVLTLRVEPGGWEAPDQAKRIRAALAMVPDRGNAAALLVRHVAVKDGKLRVDAESAEPAVAPDLFVEGPSALRFGPVIAVIGDDRHRVRFEVPVEGAMQGTLDLVLTFVDGRRAFERRVTLALP